MAIPRIPTYVLSVKYLGRAFLAAFVRGLLAAARADAELVDVIRDSFTAADGTLLQNHDPGVGAARSWIRATGAFDVVAKGNRIQNADTEYGRYLNNTLLPSANYTVSTRVRFSSASGTFVQLLGRVNTLANHYQALLFGTDQGEFLLSGHGPIPRHYAGKEKEFSLPVRARPSARSSRRCWPGRSGRRTRRTDPSRSHVGCARTRA